jgi:predicted kinase/uncharacterized glyoxalase superfamily protein PhnB
MKPNPCLIPLLVVQGAADAIAFYVRAGATVLACYEHGPLRHVSHAELTLHGATFSVTEEVRAWNSDAPPSLGGSPVVIQLEVADAELALASMLRAGATVVFPLVELLGERMARVRDPFGHLWLLRQRVEQLTNEEIQRRRDELFARHAGAATESAGAARVRSHPEEIDRVSETAARVHLVVGPVGAGKSTFGLGLAREERAVRLTLDEWMTTLFRPDRPAHGVVEWYLERSARCIDQICSVAEAVLGTGTSVVLELGLLTRRERESFYARVESTRFSLTVHVVDAAREVRRERVAERNRTQGPTFSMPVPPEIFELASDRWEPPAATECEGRTVRFLRTDG